MLGGVVLVAGEGEPAAVERRSRPAVLPLRRSAGGHRSFQRGLELPAQPRPLLVLLWGQVQNRSLGLVHPGVTISASGLCPIGLLVPVHNPLFECLKFLLIVHDFLPFFGSDGLSYRPDQALQPRPLRLQGGQVAAQGGQPVEGGVVQAPLDPGQLHPEGPVIEDVLKPVHLRRAVIAVPALRHPAGLQKTDFVVPAQGAGGHPGQARQGLNGIFHPAFPPSSTA